MAASATAWPRSSGGGTARRARTPAAAGQGPAPDRRAACPTPAPAASLRRRCHGCGRWRSPKDELLLDNVEALPRQRHKAVLQAALLGREAADPDAGRHQRGHDGFRLPRLRLLRVRGRRTCSGRPSARTTRKGPRPSRSRGTGTGLTDRPTHWRSGPAGPAPAPRRPDPGVSTRILPDPPGAAPPGFPVPPADPRS